MCITWCSPHLLDPHLSVQSSSSPLFSPVCLPLSFLIHLFSSLHLQTQVHSLCNLVSQTGRRGYPQDKQETQSLHLHPQCTSKIQKCGASSNACHAVETIHFCRNCPKSASRHLFILEMVPPQLDTYSTWEQTFVPLWFLSPHQNNVPPHSSCRLWV